MSTPTDQFPNVMIFLLAQSLALGGTETELYASTIKTLDGQTVETSDFSFLTEGIISVDVQSASAIEFISFTGVDPSGIGFTPITRGLSFKSKTVIPANVKFHPVGTPCIIAFGTHNLIDLETIIINNQATIEAQIAALTGQYLELNGGNSPTANINWGGHQINNLENGVAEQDAITLAQLQAAVIAGGIPATTSQGGYVKVATQTEFNNSTNTTVVGPYTFYNMITVSQANSIGTAQFTYGEAITAGNYVWQATGSEYIQIVPGTTTATGATLTSTSTFVGQVFTTNASQVGLISSLTITLDVSGTSGLGGSLAVQLYAASGGIPTGSVLSTTNTVSYTVLTTSSAAVTFTFPSPVSISLNSSYAIVLNTAGFTFGSQTIGYFHGTSGGVGSYFTSSNGGSSFASAGAGPLKFTLNQTFSAGAVYNVNLNNTIINIGPYKGFAINTAAASTVNPVQIAGIASGFSGLSPGNNIYISPSTPGGYTQAVGITSGRAIGIAISATQIQINPMRKRDVGQSYAFSGNNPINQDGFLFIYGSSTSSTVTVTENNGITSTIIIVIGSPSGGQGLQFTVPVQTGCIYTTSGWSASPTATFYPLING